MDVLENSGEAGRFWKWRARDDQVHDFVSELSINGWTAVTLHGSRMASLEGVFNEFSTELSFPAYFGQNWDALEECLTDLDWLNVSRGVVIAVTKLSAVREAQIVEPLVATLESTVAMWADADAQARYMARPAVAVPFHVVLQDWPGSAMSLWGETITQAQQLDEV